MSSKTTPKIGYGGPSIGIGLGVVLLFFWVVTGTVGFQEVHELSEGGRLFASFVIVAGLGTAVDTFTRLGQVLLEGELIAVFGRRRMKQNLDRLKDHIIVCGCGRIGQPVVDNLRGEAVQFCVIDRDESLVGHFQEQNVLFLVGDATEEETLRAAGVERARSLLALLPSDARGVRCSRSLRRHGGGRQARRVHCRTAPGALGEGGHWRHDRGHGDGCRPEEAPERLREGHVLKLKSKCCHKYETKAKVCRKCPLVGFCGKKKRKKIVAKLIKKAEQAA